MRSLMRGSALITSPLHFLSLQLRLGAKENPPQTSVVEVAVDPVKPSFGLEVGAWLLFALPQMALAQG